jgi:hypothetical protein
MGSIHLDPPSVKDPQNQGQTLGFDRLMDSSNDFFENI